MLWTNGVVNPSWDETFKSFSYAEFQWQNKQKFWLKKLKVWNLEKLGYKQLKKQARRAAWTEIFNQIFRL